MFNILENLHNVNIHYKCVICGTEVLQKFTESPFYANVKDDDDDVVDYVEAHMSFDDMDQLSTKQANIELHSVLCGNKECRRTQLRHNKEEILKQIKVPLIFREVPPIDSLLTEFADKVGVMYTGDVGVGKTYRAVSTLKRYILSKGGTQKVSYKFINTCDLFLHMQEEMRRPYSKDKKDVSIIRTCMDVDVLVLDDLGTEKASDWTEPNIYVLLNTRIENMKPTIVTSNMGKDEDLSARFNPRIASRLSLFNIRHLGGVDRRRN